MYNDATFEPNPTIWHQFKNSKKQMQENVALIPLIIRTKPYNLASIQKQMQHDFALIDKAVLFERLIYRGVSSQIGYETVLYIILCSI